MAHRILSPEEASAIQTALNDKARAQLVVDGHFGTLSQQALMRFQAERNISPADGNPSQPTLDALGIPNLFLPPPKLTPNPVVQAIGKFALMFLLSNLTKGKFPMLTSMDKAWVAGVVSFVCSYIVNHFFHITIDDGTQGVIVNVLATLVLPAIAVWIVPNKPKTT